MSQRRHDFPTMKTLSMLILMGACAVGVRDPGPGGPPAPGLAPDSASTSVGRPQPARRLDSTFPQIRFAGRIPGSTERAQRFLVIWVDITEEGLADLKTLRLTGPGAVENRAEIERWLLAGRYEPARDAAGRRIRSKHRIELRVGS